MTHFAKFTSGPQARGRRVRPALLAACLLGLTACAGGNSDDGAQADGQVPATAWDSPQSFTRFVSGLEEQSGEPLSMDGLDLPPTSETAEPEPWS